MKVFVYIALGCVLIGLTAARAQGARSVWDGVYTDAQAARGRAAYDQACSTCHGASLTGVEEASPLTGGAFMANWNGLTVGDLLDRIRVSMPAGNPSAVSQQDKADIVAYILQFNKFPAGDAELSRQADALRDMTIQATKP